MAGAARDDGTAAEQQDAERGSHERRECMACRGTGQVISNLGASPTRVSCPWCEGSGYRLPAVDAQARWRDGEGEAEAHGDRREPPAPGEGAAAPEAAQQPTGDEPADEPAP